MFGLAGRVAVVTGAAGHGQAGRLPSASGDPPQIEVREHLVDARRVHRSRIGAVLAAQRNSGTTAAAAGGDLF